TQAEKLGVKPGIQQSPLLELCCQRMSAKASYQQAARDIDLLTGVSVSAKTQERIVNRTPIEAPEITESVAEVDLDGGMVRLVGDPGQPSEWKQYKAVRVNGDGPGMAWFQDNSALLDWLHHLTFVSLFYCLGDGHAGIWSLFAQLEVPQIAEEILDWYHLIENLHKVGGSLKRLQEAESLLWEGQVDKTLALFAPVKTDPSRRFQTYLQTHRSRIPNYRYYQMEGLPIGSGPVESWIKQIDERVQITGARWKPERVPQILALRCAYLSGRLDLFSPLKV
ncbi:ISKra4 family transposase, partial [Nodosilinea sp. P-1105]|uniref:ISKra4 family transposase n=1 Tax=Nodosilinea sp. P-1105 TaxID=2546229 RepID=UPI001469BA8A